MTSAMQWLGSPMAVALLHAVGWTLLHFLWQGTLVALILWCALCLVRSSEVRYGVACAALGLMVALPAITLARLTEEAERGQGQMMALEFRIDASAEGDGAGGLHEPLKKRIEHEMDAAAGWAPVLWMAGVAFCLVRLGRGMGGASRIRATGSSDVPAELFTMLEDARARLGIDRTVSLLHSAAVQVPTVIGWLKPVVLIPVGCFAGMSAEQAEAILCHELAHVRRHDYAVSVLQSAVEALLFYHPAVWWVSRQIRQERECCCDAMAVEAGGEVAAYARALSLLEERRDGMPALALGADGGVLMMRIRRLLGVERRAPGSPWLAGAVLGMMVCAAAFYAVRAAQAQPVGDAAEARHGLESDPRLSAKQGSGRSSGAGAPVVQVASAQKEGIAAGGAPKSDGVPLVYRKWLNEDVRWIITAEERSNFLKLTNDDERDAFIASFWRRRDAPGAAPNSYREAYYGRIAYANQHFAGKDQAGWRTDRGHAYLALGKPDEIEAHPGGGADGYPYEMWHYAAVPGMGKNVSLRFVDSCECGDYKLAFQAQPAASVSGSAAPQSETQLKNGIRVSSAVIAALIESRVAPVYPAEAKAAGIQGTVLLHAVISKAGTVKALQVVSGPPALAASALDAVRQWRYRPYLVNGAPVEVDTTITVHYSLDNPSDSDGSSLGRDHAVDPVKKIGGGVSSPIVIYQAEPEYTEQARRAKFMGTVLVGLIVDKTGRPEDVHIVRGVGLGLNDKAVQAIRKYRFKPAMEEGRPVAVALNVEVNFQIF